MQGLYKQFSNHRRKLISIFAFLVLYSLAGFLLLPWYLEKQLVSITQDRLALNSSVDNIYFNPFSFYFEINDVVINELDGKNLLKLSHFNTNFQASRLLLLKAQLANVTLDGMELNFERLSQTDNTLTVLAKHWANSSPQDSINDTSSELSADSELLTDEEAVPSNRLPAIEILSLSLKNINANLTDSSLPTAFKTTVGIQSLQIDSFSTILDARGTNQITIDFEQQSQLTVNGDFGINPLQFDGTVSLDNFPADIASRYAQDTLPARIDSGRVNIEFDYFANLAETVPAIVLDNVMVELQTLAITENNTAAPFAELHSVAIANAELNIPENSIHLESLILDGFELDAELNNEKQLNLLRMVESLEASLALTAPSQLDEPEVSANVSADATPWRAHLDSFVIRDTNLSFRDESLEQLFTLTSTLNGSIDNISTQENSSFPLDLNVRLGSGGDILVNGDVQVIPELTLNSTVSITDLDLTVAQPYINEYVFAELQRGVLEIDAQLAATSTDPFSFRGSLSLRDLTASDSQLDETLVAFDSLAIDAMNFSTTANSFEISEVSLSSLFARVIINEDGSSNISRSIKPPAASPNLNTNSTPNLAEQNSPPLAITVGQVRIDNGSANFTDRDLPIVFNANISSLSGSAEGFATNTSQPTNINLEGEVDEFGLVQINSVLKPFAVTDQSQIQVNFTNINMPAMTPYVIKFAGREIAEGTVDLILNYDVESGELQANNQLILNNLKLGERIESPDAIDLPLDLALALLKDGNGVIDLEIPITGDVNDPEFNFGPAIRRALSNVFTNIVAAPFRLLGNLVGSGENSLESIRFLPGRTDIAAPEREVLVKLGEALQLRPQLMLDIPPVNAAQDSTALKTAAVNKRIDDALELTQSSNELLTTRRRIVLENLYLTSTLVVSLSEIQRLHTPAQDPTSITSDTVQASTSSPNTGLENPVLDIIAYNNDLRRRLIDQEALAATALQSLANARATAVTQFLVSDGGISPQRIRLSELNESELDENGWLSMVFELSSSN